MYMDGFVGDVTEKNGCNQWLWFMAVRFLQVAIPLIQKKLLAAPAETTGPRDGIYVMEGAPPDNLGN